jgi:hypothetical protein
MNETFGACTIARVPKLHIKFVDPVRIYFIVAHNDTQSRSDTIFASPQPHRVGINVLEHIPLRACIWLTCSRVDARPTTISGDSMTKALEISIVFECYDRSIGFDTNDRETRLEQAGRNLVYHCALGEWHSEY